MKLTKKLEAEVLKAYKAYWDAYLDGDMKIFASFLDDNITVFGTAISEVFNNKKETFKFYKATAHQLVGKVQLRNREFKLQAIDNNILINEQSDLYVLIEKKWTYYGSARITAVLKQTKSGWKLIHQHASFPDMRTEEGEQVAAEKIKEENLQLRDAVKRRTLELEEKNRELEIESAVERVRAKALAMHRSEDIHEVLRSLRNELFGLQLEGIIGATICLKQADGLVRLWDITDVETTGRYGWDILFDIKRIDAQLWVKEIWNSKKKIIATEQNANDLKRTLKWLSKYDKKTADSITKLLKANKIKHGWHRSVKLNNGVLITDFFNEPPAEIGSILLKLGAAFDLAYKRFLDLRNAETQTREAQIEAALERVRSRTMAMHQTSELQEVIHTVHNELLNLKLSIYGGSFVVINNDVGPELRCWGSGGTANTSEEVQVPNFNMPFCTNLIKGIKKGPGFFTEEFSQKEKKEYFTKLFKHKPWSKLSNTQKKETLSSLGGYTRSVAVSKHTTIFIINHNGRKFTEDENDILKRFAKVFEQTYTRFLDLQKAEAQTREAQIEASLERIRSVSMAIRKSNELFDIIHTVFDEWKRLGLELYECNINLLDPERKAWTNWGTGIGEATLPRSFQFPWFDDPFVNQFYQDSISGISYRTYMQEGKELKKFLDGMFIHTDFKNAPEEYRKELYSIPKIYLSHAFMKYGSMDIVNSEPPPEATIEILKRFSKVFEQAYTRYLDVVNAEAQARESQIELALERVRARTMAMHNSSDLLEVVKILGEQFELLGFKFDSVNFNTDYKEKDWKLWLYNSGSAMYPGQIHIPYLDHPCFNRVHELFKIGADFQSFVFTKEEKDSFFDHIYANSVAKYGSQERKKYTYSKPGMAMSVAVSKNTSVTITNYDGRAFSEDENAILRRFANVFEQTYTRFLDLQKAEAQAREAQIQLSLERVRARAMAMYHSDELNDVLSVLFEQFDALGINPVFAHLSLFDLERNLTTLYITGKGGKRSMAQKIVPIDAMEEWKEELNNWKTSKPSSVSRIYYKKDVFPQIWNLFGDLFDQLPGDSKINPDDFPGGLYCIQGNTGFGYIGLNHTREATDEEKDIILRFATEFGRVYQRFLDLQKAETQAREAKIEAALEKVRARTMSMQRSDELPQAANLLFQQIQSLGMPAFAAGYCIWEDDKQAITLWMSSEGVLQPPFKAPTTEDELFIQMRKGYEEGKSLHVVEMGGEELVAHYQYMRTLPVVGEIFDSILKAGHSLPVFQVMHQAYFSKGFLLFITYERVPESHDIFKRFATVFDQTYTRFLDLKKAELQTREAQIELGLERVRSRAMAMQTSEELNELIGTVFTELTKLDLVLTRCVIWVFDPATDSPRWWMANSEEPANPMNFLIKYHEHPAFLTFLQEWKKQNVRFIYDLKGEDKTSWDDILFNETELVNLPDVVKNGMRSPERILLSASFNNFGGINVASLEPLSDEHFDILLRFAKVFDLTYTRFNDLKQAEAQAREAQIELGLERVRARAMAMHRSDELKELIATMSSELGKLDLVLDRCFIIIYDLNTMGSTWWMANPETPTEPIGLHVQYHDHIPYLEHIKSWRQRKIKWEYVLEGKVKKTWDQFLFVETGLSQLPPPVVENMRSKEKVFLSSSFNNFGYLTLATLDPLTDQQFDIMLRFAKVFDLTYTRFNDLKQAEAQAREAQIEAALEKVRARTMGMQKSGELDSVIKTVYAELKHLDVLFDRCFIMIFDEQKGATWWMGSPEDDLFHQGFYVQYHTHPPHLAYLKGWEERQQKWEYLLGGQIKKDWDEFIFSKTELSKLPPPAIQYMRSFDHAYLAASFESFGCMTTGGQERLNEESLNILNRFAKVFDQTYTRFLDLQKAEVQTRESQIQLALERVRARTMAMQKSEELPETSFLLFQQMKELGATAVQNSIGIVKEDEGLVELSTTVHGHPEPKTLHVPVDDPHVMAKAVAAWKAKRRSLIVEIKGQDLKEYNKFRNTFLETKVEFPEDNWIVNLVFFSKGWLSFSSNNKIPDEAISLLARFAGVFDLTYTRFLDLKQAEEQARESQIQLALERVRARTMAMHRSEELSETAQIMFHQLQELGGIPDRIAIGIANEAQGIVTYWSTDQSGIHIDKTFKARLNERTVLSKTYQAWKENKKSLVVDLQGDDVNEWIKFAREEMGVPVKDDNIKDRRVHTFSFFSHGWILVTTHEPQSAETIQILERFASVFNLTYRRFLDLQTAEAQAHEARIEISLERIRARALAMHKSDELIEVAKVVWEQMTLLGQRELESSVVHLYEEDPDHIHSYRAVSINTDSNNKLTYGHMAIPKNSCEVVREWLEKFHSDETEYTIEISGQRQQEWYELLFKLAPEVVNSMRQKGNINEKRYYRFSKFSGGALLMVLKQEPSEEASYLQKRAAAVFDLAYRRFSDLQKAEAQAREAQIESALEKVRSRSLAMHKSDELQEVVNTVFERLTDLNVEMDSCNIAIFKEGKKDWDYWIASPFQKRSAVFYMPYINFGVTKDLVDAKESGADFFEKSYKHEEKNAWFEYSFKNTDFKYLSEQRQKYILNAPAMTVGIAFAKYTGVQFNRYSLNKLTEGEIDILKRFAKVFEQAYIRFLDLERAEAQARESQIEAALERVRAKAMAMHKTEDLNPAVSVVFEEMKKLNIGVLRCGISILDKEKRTGDVWVTSINEQGSAVQVSGGEPFDIHPLLQGAFDAWLEQKDFSYLLEGDDLTRYYKAVKAVNFQLPDLEMNSSETGFKRQYCFTAVYQAGGLFAFREKEFTDEAKKVMKRFANVFDLTYKRFIDLQKAEANAREAQIEAGLERVRARTMAMHSSEDVSMATATMFSELEKLGIENLRGGITIIKPDQTQEVWSITNLPDGRIIRAIGVFDMRMHPLWRALLKAKENKEDYDYYWLAGKDKEDYIAILNATPNYLAQPIKEIPDVHVQSYFFGEGGVWTNSLQPHSEEDKLVMKKFASVFSLTFRRYQDLKKAEAQAREATIEAALEKVRGKAMAMHNSNDLSVTTSMIITELKKLGIIPLRCGVGIIDKETHKGQLYTATSSPDGDSLSVIGWVLLQGHPVLENIYEKWLMGEDYFPELSGDSRSTYYEKLLAGLPVPVPDFKDEKKHYGHFFSFSVGCLYAWSEIKYNEDEIKILKRFATIIDLTFRRYFELQKSEANAREAVKQAALDRVRADIASMRTINDLDRITPLIWNELTTLNIPFIRCGVFIMDESSQLIHTFLSTPDGKAIAAFHLPYDTPGNISKVIDNWRVKKIYVDHWGEEEFVQFADILMKQGALSSKEQYLKTIPRGGFKLHFFPFLQGMLYVGNAEQLNDEQIELIQHVADAFSTAYARYEDFNRLEAAKKQVENTLTDLKQAQQQLVQSEKMASLGELTAGIAHEIQNPLNFVNNFSDVSNELLEEMKNELEKGNKEVAITIVEDVKQNLEKILHHGKRADAIVKGMLQHSRTSSGQKELTDINLLTDEYLRLAFHGLRAKDKTFNAKFETHFDNNIGKVNVIPQDIGRVILNLINNAFYTVSEKKKENDNGYEPTVTVTTLKENGRIEIKVKDNGNGIPQKVLDKIFQPFFTTKPTGQGTGLGLSLAYDIITKGHNGELKVETKEGEGSEFVIELPAL